MKVAYLDETYTLGVTLGFQKRTLLQRYVSQGIFGYFTLCAEKSRITRDKKP